MLDPAVLLGRSPVSLDTPELQRFIAGKRVMVTGAGGSIGSEICRQAARFCPERLILVERAEGALFEIDHELRRRWIGLDPVPLLLDVTDPARVDRAIARHKPQVIFHAAAHKHVPLMEHNAGEAVRNNIFGTLNVARAALHSHADAFVLISTDKAVNPSSVMGATKRVAELAVLGLTARRSASHRLDLKSHDPSSPIASIARPDRRAPDNHTRFTAVRFGNVLASSGSVVPIFLKQIAAGGPVTVTHADMQRYFMTIPEASQLVMQAGAIGHDASLFVLDMGQPIRILDLAHRLIALHRLRVGRDIELRITGVRPGEKLFEELCYDDETTAPSGHDRIRLWRSTAPDPASLEAMLADLHDVIDADDTTVRATLARHLPEYQPQDRTTPLKLVA